MDRGCKPEWSKRRGFPRRRGDGPSWFSLRPSVMAFPPQARGWTLCRRHDLQGHGVSPAGAGMDRRRVPAQTHHSSFPRRRGDGPLVLALLATLPPFPPQARGWTAENIKKLVVVEVSPAGAGMDPMRLQKESISRCFPRRRGDGPSHFRERSGRFWFPPQARGWTRFWAGYGVGIPVSPAGAGMDPWRHHSRALSSCFPRRRGDGPGLWPWRATV